MDFYNSAKTSASSNSSIYTSVVTHEIKFYCKINNDNSSINVKYTTPGSDARLSVLLETRCTKIK